MCWLSRPRSQSPFSPRPFACHSDRVVRGLAGLAMPAANITEAAVVPAGAAPFHASRAFCRVLVTMTPTSDSDIKVEVWLPVDGWNGKFQAVGNGDAAGVISYAAMTEAVDRGYATSSTDTGHVGNTMAFALGHREKYVDFGYRSLHEMTVKAKAIIDAFYGTPPALSYWNGCSQGGRQGITEAARYPADYDAIIAGAPAIDHMQLHAARMALNVFVHRTGDSYIPPEKYPAIHRAALNACDALDGLKDGLIADPTRCRFDPRVLECTSGDAPLVPDGGAGRNGARHVRADQRIRQRAASSRPRSLSLAPNWSGAGLRAPNRCEMRWNRSNTSVFNDPKWDWRAFSLATDLPRALQADAGRHQFHGSEPGIVLRARRQAADVPRMGGSSGDTAEQHRLFQRRPESRPANRRAGKSIELYMAAGREPLLGRRRP